jgi:hypothetical protein
MVRVRSSPSDVLQPHHSTDRNRQLLIAAAHLWSVVLPRCGSLGNANFNSFTGSSGFSSDFSLTKNFTITERVTAQFRFDAYNIFNHPILDFNSNQGNTCLDCTGSTGKITDIQADASPGSPNGMRQLQFGARWFSKHNHPEYERGAFRRAPLLFVFAGAFRRASPGELSLFRHTSRRPNEARQRLKNMEWSWCNRWSV